MFCGMRWKKGFLFFQKFKSLNPGSMKMLLRSYSIRKNSGIITPERDTLDFGDLSVSQYPPYKEENSTTTT